ncbi:ribonuclease III [Corynebacterium terpenotabidum]|uniref:Ribonuclease 3 n=1 Tax=Corynebacterium terpenotabidum Y-11 TaxID=1200352 RepID=S4XEQ3_9CORY|nr:ribonuclease III [Corynebacterium terpenotabidum]AGP31044.1 ribonuclease III [Corynebacterium terpenotabidum Y-11]
MSRKRRLTGEPALDAAFGKTDHTPLLESWGVELSDEMLRLALSHRSFANENGNLPNNERLEFLGDAVLGLSVAEQLYRQFPDRSESDISKMRAGVVNMYALAGIARELNMGDFVLLGRGEMLTGGRDKHSILADSVEAMLGAIYLECGFDVARATVLRIFEQKITTAPSTGLTMDWKTVLVEKLSDLRIAAEPQYTSEVDGPDHDQTFTATVIINGEVRGHGEGHTKKEAEHHAAREAYRDLSGLTD